MKYILLLVAILVTFSACEEERGCVDCNGHRNTERHNVHLAVTAMMAGPNPPIWNLETDLRIDSFHNDESNPINDLTNGGLVTIVEEYFNSGSVMPPSYYLEKTTTEFYFIVDEIGRVREFRDRNGEEDIL